VADLLITHGIVVTMDPARRVLRDGAVAIEDGTIIAVGSTAEVAAVHRASRTIDASGKVAMPGLIDSHAHGGHGLVKTMGGGDTDAWFRACEEIYARGSDESFWQAEAALAALERLKCGTTTGVSLLGGGDHILRCDDVAFGTAYCQAIAEIGIRGVVAVGPCRPPFPKHFSRWRGATAEPRSVSFAQQHHVSEALIKQWHRGAGGRLRMAVSFPVHDPMEQPNDAVSLGEIREQAAAMRVLARRYGVIFTQDGHKGGTIELAHREFDLLGPFRPLHRSDRARYRLMSRARRQDRSQPELDHVDSGTLPGNRAHRCRCHGRPGIRWPGTRPQPRHVPARLSVHALPSPPLPRRSRVAARQGARNGDHRCGARPWPRDGDRLVGAG
jgi:5-methylthioadenosine/S-adenosylhomocysteine deaminase